MDKQQETGIRNTLSLCPNWKVPQSNNHTFFSLFIQIHPIQEQISKMEIFLRKIKYFMKKNLFLEKSFLGLIRINKELFSVQPVPLLLPHQRQKRFSLSVPPINPSKPFTPAWHLSSPPLLDTLTFIFRPLFCADWIPYSPHICRLIFSFLFTTVRDFKFLNL